MTERKRAEEESQLLQTLTQAISEASDFHTTLLVALLQVCEVTGGTMAKPGFLARTTRFRT